MNLHQLPIIVWNSYLEQLATSDKPKKFQITSDNPEYQHLVENS